MNIHIRTAWMSRIGLPLRLRSLCLFGQICLLTLIGVFTSGQASAIGTISAKVIHVRVDQNGLGMVIFNQNVGGAFAACRDSVNYANALSFNVNNAGGKAILAMALAAKASGETIVAYGDGSCSNYGAYVENWSYGISL